MSAPYCRETGGPVDPVVTGEIAMFHLDPRSDISHHASLPVYDSEGEL